MSRYDHKIETSLEGIELEIDVGTPPNSEIKERIRKRYERERIKIEKLLTLGYTTSGDPWKITTK